MGVELNIRGNRGFEPWEAYDNGDGSDVIADPRLQSSRRDLTRSMSKALRDVDTAQNAPERLLSKEFSAAKKGALGIAAIAGGITLLTTLSIGAGVATGGGLLIAAGLIALIWAAFSAHKASQFASVTAPTIESVHDHAREFRVNNILEYFQDRPEREDGRRADGRRDVRGARGPRRHARHVELAARRADAHVPRRIDREAEEADDIDGAIFDL